MKELAKRVLAWREEGKDVAIAVVVRTWGSSPQDAGAMMAVCEDGRMAGSLSGGCIEGSVMLEASDVMRTRKPRLLDYGVRDEDAWDVGAPCGGDIQIALFPYDDELFGLAMRCIERGEPFEFAACTLRPHWLQWR